MDVSHWITVSLLFVFCAAALGFFFAPSDADRPALRAIFAAIVGLWTAGVIFWSWVAYVIIHFVAKFW